MRPHRSTVIGMVTAGLLALALLGPVAFAMLTLRSMPEGGRGVSAGGWLVVGLLLMLAVAAAAALGGALVVLVRWAWRRLRDPSA